MVAIFVGQWVGLLLWNSAAVDDHRMDYRDICPRHSCTRVNANDPLTFISRARPRYHLLIENMFSIHKTRYLWILRMNPKYFDNCWMDFHDNLFFLN